LGISRQTYEPERAAGTGGQIHLYSQFAEPFVISSESREYVDGVCIPIQVIMSCINATRSLPEVHHGTLREVAVSAHQGQRANYVLGWGSTSDDGQAISVNGHCHRLVMAALNKQL